MVNSRPWVRGRSLIYGMIALSTTPPSSAHHTNVSLRSGFENPPNSARPRTWWHWMNGNITRAGVDLDLAWMKRVGLGGVQVFDASLATPQIVPKRLAYMSTGWQRVFRHAVERADRLGLEMAIASAPGWSETGGPW